MTEALALALTWQYVSEQVHDDWWPDLPPHDPAQGHAATYIVRQGAPLMCFVV